ncbi:J domain-containing protein [Noviherbaspirillum galbum]|uniref:J domain-containing protein n=1 Tax=Noviherbaspirillum galbum TaxID=2709383 RepID=A0A6B3SH97_9BURK|nr:J domain-containing protein [Noviherbaspirillum galbum]NEX60038.1 J domain-containing protein [Noviherbaspirillum galbum]
MKNHYSTLGVLPTAEIAVIKAAWRVLCQIYHPDKYEGDKAHGEAMIKEINEAWEVLGNPEKRKEYDAQFANGKGTFSQAQAASESPSDFRKELLDAFPELEFTAEYYPDIWTTIDDLKRISRNLAAGFVAALLETKAFKQRVELADRLSAAFFTIYFGTDEKILGFAKQLVDLGLRDAALELNQAVNTFGEGIEPDLVISKIQRKHSILDVVRRHKEDELKRRRERHEREAVEKNMDSIRRTFEDLRYMRETVGPGNMQALVAAIEPLRRGLSIQMDFEKVERGFLSSFAKDWIVLTGPHETWKFYYDSVFAPVIQDHQRY